MAWSKKLLFKINNIYDELNKKIVMYMRRSFDQKSLFLRGKISNS